MKRKILVLFGLLLLLNCCNKQDKELKITEYVNPFIGTNSGGHCFPGAIVPFGGIQLGPDNPLSSRHSGYHYSDSVIASFSHTHFNGSEKTDFQDIRLLPVLNTPTSEQIPELFIKSSYAKFSHSNEFAEPGYYSVTFDNGIKTELSVTPRCGIHYYQYPEGSTYGLTIDLATSTDRNKTLLSSLRKINNRTLAGFRKSAGEVDEHRVYFVIEFSQDCKIFAGKDKFELFENDQQIIGDTCYAWIDFGKTTNKILVKIGISSANIEGAIANLEKELPHWSFDKVKKDAKQHWKRELVKTRAESKDEELLRIFYTALYHSYLTPHVYSDANGNYKGADNEIHSTPDRIQYTLFPTRDIYTSVFPLFTLTQRKRVTNMIHSMLKHYTDFGLLPIYEIAGNETFDAIGNHAVSMISEAYTKGIKNYNQELAFYTMKRNIMAKRGGMNLYRELGYIPAELENQSIAKTLEYAYDDWCVAQMAKEMGKEDEYLLYLRSSRNFTNLFDTNNGFLSKKFKSGEWGDAVSLINPDYEQNVGENLHMYSWFAPHDIEGLIALYQGPEQFKTKLESFFTWQPESEDHIPAQASIGRYFHNDGVAHHIPYLYNYVGEPQKTQFYVDKIRKEFYSSKPDGLCGNDNYGQLSAWYVFSALGFYPVNPADGKYQLGTPLFNKVVMKIAPEKKFTILANKESDKHIFVKEVFLNGDKLERTWITHDEIMNGGKLEFVLDSKL